MSTSKEVLFDLPKYLDIIKKPISLRSIEMVSSYFLVAVRLVWERAPQNG